MLCVEIEPTKIIQEHPVIISKTKHERKGKTRKSYKKYTVTFPYWYIELYNTGKDIYIYKQENNYYITPTEPISLPKEEYKHITIQQIKSPLTTKIIIPKKLVINIQNYNTIKYIFIPDKTDPITNTHGTLKFIPINK